MHYSYSILSYKYCSVVSTMQTVRLQIHLTCSLSNLNALIEQSFYFLLFRQCKGSLVNLYSTQWVVFHSILECSSYDDIVLTSYLYLSLSTQEQNHFFAWVKPTTVITMLSNNIMVKMHVYAFCFTKYCKVLVVCTVGCTLQRFGVIAMKVT